MTRHLSRFFTGAALVGVCAASTTATSAPATMQTAPAGFTSLFNGTDTSGWVGMSSSDPRQYIDMAPETEDTQRQAEQAAFGRHWRVDNGQLVHDGAGPLATSQRRYGDVELRLEYQVFPKPAATVVLAGAPPPPAAIVHLRGTPLQQAAPSNRAGS